MGCVVCVCVSGVCCMVCMVYVVCYVGMCSVCMGRHDMVYVWGVVYGHLLYM